MQNNNNSSSRNLRTTVIINKRNFEMIDQSEIIYAEIVKNKPEIVTSANYATSINSNLLDITFINSKNEVLKINNSID